MSELQWVSLRPCIPPHTPWTILESSFSLVKRLVVASVMWAEEELRRQQTCPLHQQPQEPACSPLGPRKKQSLDARTNCRKHLVLWDYRVRLPQEILDFQNRRLPISRSFQNFVLAPDVKLGSPPWPSQGLDLTELSSKEQGSVCRGLSHTYSSRCVGGHWAGGGGNNVNT